MKGRLHHSAVSKMHGFFVCQKAFTQNLVHSLEADPFDEGVLLFHQYVNDPFGAEEGYEQLSSKKEGGAVAVVILKLKQEFGRILQKSNGQQAAP
jgi:hypothetical protein